MVLITQDVPRATVWRRQPFDSSPESVTRRIVTITIKGFLRSFAERDYPEGRLQEIEFVSRGVRGRADEDGQE